MKKLIAILLLTIFTISLCGCSTKEEVVPYDLSVCDAEMTEMYAYLEQFADENHKVDSCEVTFDKSEEYIDALKENADGLNSITVYSRNVSDEIAQSFINLAKKKNIPVTFAFSAVSDEVLTSYDKAFSIETNYLHAAEMTAEKIKQLWSEGVIADADKNMIFSFSVVKNSELSPEMQGYYERLIADIELYGVPMQLVSEISPEEIYSAENLIALNEANEALIIIDSTALPYINQYTPYGSGVEIICLSQAPQNPIEQNSFVSNCFIDYAHYKTAADEIISNFNNRQYPLISISFPVIDRTVFIPAEI